MKKILSTRSNQKTVQLCRFKTPPSDSFLYGNILGRAVQTKSPLKLLHMVFLGFAINFAAPFSLAMDSG